MWDAGRDHECVTLRDVALEVRLGLYDAERLAPQPVLVDVELYRRRELPAAGEERRFEDCLDYDRVYRYLTDEWPRRPHVELLERLAEDLVAFCLADERVEACRVAIRKPGIYAGRGTPGVELYRRRAGE